MISDISKEKELELSLFETKKIQVTDSKRLYNNIPGGVFQCMFNKQWTIVNANEGFYKFLGYTEKTFYELFQNNAVEVIFPNDREEVFQLTALQLSKDIYIRNQMRVIKKDGT